MDYDGLKALIKTIEKKLKEIHGVTIFQAQNGSDDAASQDSIGKDKGSPSHRNRRSSTIGYGSMLSITPKRTLSLGASQHKLVASASHQSPKDNDDTIKRATSSDSAVGLFVSPKTEKTKLLEDKDDATITVEEKQKPIRSEEEEEEEDADPDEMFFDAIEGECQKVEGFYSYQAQEFRERLQLMNETIQKVNNKKKGKKSKHDSDDDDDDEGKQRGSVSRDVHVMDSIKRSFVELYRQMNYLMNYTILNYTAFVKISKKHDKQLARNTKKRCMRIVDRNSFCQASNLKQQIAELEKLFAHTFHGDNLTVARSDLLVKVIIGKKKNALTLIIIIIINRRIARIFNSCMLVFVWVVWWYVTKEKNTQQTTTK